MSGIGNLGGNDFARQVKDIVPKLPSAKQNEFVSSLSKDLSSGPDVTEANKRQFFNMLHGKYVEAGGKHEDLAPLFHSLLSHQLTDDFKSSFLSEINPAKLKAVAPVVSSIPMLEVDEKEHIDSKASAAPKSLDLTALPKPPLSGSDRFPVSDANAGFRYKTDRFTEANLMEAHENLIAQGYAFVGFNGTQEGVAELRVNEGITKVVSARPNTDPWNGLYVAKDLDVASGYAVPADDKDKKPVGKTNGDLVRGAMIRVYLPKDVVANMKVSDIPLGDGYGTKEAYEKSKQESAQHLSQKLGFALGSDKVYVVSGPQDKENLAHETILSWGAAQGAVFIPSLLQSTNDGSGRLDKRSINAYEMSISK